ncbi:enoyl-CoA hydratase-related protein [Dactylosporangium sp. NPDC049525]|uniref:enoyl-CoA hydratase-related protein n=1 Tax=Dactylosporangium sp. NPDC049525 TaxID=3154730 RepID=UPI0034375882
MLTDSRSTVPALEVRRRGPVATVTLHGTGAGNALGGAVFTGLPQVLGDLAGDDSASVVVLRGAGGTFSVGLDLRWYLPQYRRITRLGDDKAAARRALYEQTRAVQHAISAVEDCPLPVVAAVTGSCVGAALELVAACDVRVAAADAVFTAREVDIDLVADLGLLQRLPRIVGEGTTAYLALTGTELGAAEALRVGLVSAVYDTPAGLEQVADLIAGHERHVLAGIKHVLHASRDLSVARGLELSAAWTAAFMPTTTVTERLRERLGGTS